MTFLSHTVTWVVCSAVMLQLGEATGVQQQRLRDAGMRRVVDDRDRKSLAR